MVVAKFYLRVGRQTLEPRRDLRSDDADQRPGRGLEDDGNEATTLQLRRDFGAYESAPDHRHHAALVQFLQFVAHPQFVVSIAQGQNVVVGAEREPASPSTGGDHDVRALEARAVLQLHRDGFDVEADRAHAQAKRDVARGEAFGRGQRRALDVPLAGQHVLGKGRAIVGRVGLFADQRDRAVVSVSSQRLHQPPPSETGPDDDDVVRGLEHVQGANIASHCSALAGTNARLCRRTSPMGALGSAE